MSFSKIKNYLRGKSAPKIPTDLEIFNAIYRTYYEEYARRSKNLDVGVNKIHIPIDIEALSRSMNITENVIFGRLYYHHEQKYGYVKADSSIVMFFVKELGKERHVINFPLMVSVLADLRTDEDRNKKTLNLARWAFVVSIVSAAISAVSAVSAWSIFFTLE